jgi:GNAT superfamily N-acetyltransferase
MTGIEPRIRPATRADLPDVAMLRRRVFRHSEHATVDGLAAYLGLVFFDNPWVDTDLPSLAVEAPGGEIVGFMGRVVRPYRQGSRTLRGAVASEVMIDPDFRGRGLGSTLMRVYLYGGQDFTVADRANEGYRRRCMACGGETAAWYSWYWSVPVRPFRYGAGQLGWRGAVRLSRPVTQVADALAGHVFPGRFRIRQPSGSCRPLELEEIPRLLPECVEANSVMPRYDSIALRWLLQRLNGRVGVAFRAVDQCAVTVAPHGTVGWFIGVDGFDGVYETVQMAGIPGFRNLVFAHLVHRGWRRGATAVAGRCDPFLRTVMAEERVRFTLAQPWVVVHAPDPKIGAAFQSGDVFLSRLEAEWWMGT